MTPYEVIYAKPPPSIPHYILGSSNNEAVNSLLSTRDAIHASLKRRLLKVQAAMKKHADMKWRDVDCEVGQWVYVKLCPYRQLFVIGAAPHKLVKRYFGPFLILEHVGNVAYHLQLLKNSKIHSFHHTMVHSFLIQNLYFLPLLKINLCWSLSPYHPPKLIPPLILRPAWFWYSGSVWLQKKQLGRNGTSFATFITLRTR